MLTVNPPAIHQNVQVAPVSRENQSPKLTKFRESGNFVLSTINGQVVTTPRASVTIDENGLMTIPLLDRYC